MKPTRFAAALVATSILLSGSNSMARTDAAITRDTDAIAALCLKPDDPHPDFESAALRLMGSAQAWVDPHAAAGAPKK